MGSKFKQGGGGWLQDDCALGQGGAADPEMLAGQLVGMRVVEAPLAGTCEAKPLEPLAHPLPRELGVTTPQAGAAPRLLLSTFACSTSASVGQGDFGEA